MGGYIQLDFLIVVRIEFLEWTPESPVAPPAVRRNDELCAWPTTFGNSDTTDHPKSTRFTLFKIVHTLLKVHCLPVD